MAKRLYVSRSGIGDPPPIVSGAGPGEDNGMTIAKRDGRGQPAVQKVPK